MSDNKDLINLESMTVDTQDVQSYYQSFNAALQQSQDYREKLLKYQDKVASMPEINQEDTEVFEVIESVLNAASSPISSFSNWLYGDSTPRKSAQASEKTAVVTSEIIPTQAELSRLCRVRDAAFFEYMRSLDLDVQTETRVFEPDTRKLTAADELTKPYLKSSIRIRRQVVELQNTIEATLNSQRSWMDFIIESVFPAFLLKLMGYINFQEMITEIVKILSQDHTNLTKEHKLLDDAFAQQWSENFPGIPRPRDLEAANAITLFKHVHAIDNELLSTVYLQYDKAKTVSNLIDLYRLVCQLKHNASEDDSMAVKAQNLEGIVYQLGNLHPDMTERFASETATTERELDLLNSYRSAAPRQDDLDLKAVFLKELDAKYRGFLTSRTLNTFEELYHHIHDHPQFRKERLVKKTRDLLQKKYAQAYQVVREHTIPHINEPDCEQFLNKYDKRNYDHPVYTKLIEFMREPTSCALMTLEQLMYLTDANDDLDQGFATMIADFMRISSTISVISVADMSSEQYSVSSFDGTDASRSLTSSSSPNARPTRVESFDSTSGSPTLSVQALEHHNADRHNDPRMFGNSGHSSSRTHNGHTYSSVPSIMNNETTTTPLCSPDF